MAQLRIYHWSRNVEHINRLISKMEGDKEMLVPLFLLRAQIIEFALKSLLIHAPYKFEGFSPDDISKKPLGTVIGALEKCGDTHLEQIITSAKAFLTFRNEITHHLVDGGRSFEEIANDIESHLDITIEIERGIMHFANFVEETLGVNFEEIG